MNDLQPSDSVPLDESPNHTQIRNNESEVISCRHLCRCQNRQPCSCGLGMRAMKIVLEFSSVVRHLWYN